MKTDLDKIVKVVTGEASPEEINSVNEWISESEENLMEFQSIKSLWDLTEAFETPQVPSSEEMWEKIGRKINEKENGRATEQGFDFSWIIKIAAVLLLGISGVLLYKHISQVEPVKNNLEAVTSKPAEVIKNTLFTASGQRLTCALPDGSIVYLNADSRIIYPRNFTGDKREVELYGEAFFSVQHDKTRPFIVTSGNSRVTVTGTEFNVRNRNRRINVVVSKGSVNVLSIKCNKEENLKAGEMVEIIKSGDITPPLNVNLKYALAWRQNKLAFDHTTLREVMSEIERTFNVKAEFLNHSAYNRTITGIFDTDSLGKILKVMSITLDMNITQKGMKIIIE